MWDMILAFAYNLTLLLALIFCYGGLRAWVGLDSHAVRWQLLIGLLFGLASVLCQTMPIIVQPGVYIDNRIAPVALSALFGGPWSSVVAALMAATQRYQLGGVGVWPGITSIISTAVLSILVLRYLGGSKLLRILIIAPLAVLVTLPWVLLLPDGFALLRNMGVPVALMYPAGIVMLGVLLLREEHAIALRQAVRRSAERFQQLVDGAPDGIILAQADSGRIIDANPAACALVGRTREQLMGMHQRDLHAELEQAGIFQRQQEELRRDGRCAPQEMNMRHADGSSVPVEVNAQLIGFKGQPVLVGYFRDLRERRQARHALAEARALTERIVREANVMIVGLDADDVVRLFNPAAERITGYREEEIIGRNWFDLLVPRTRFPAVWEALHVQAKEHIPKQFEYPIITKEGQIRVINWQNMVLDSGPMSVCLIGFGFDVTEQRDLENQLRHAEKMQAVGQLAGGVAHDFNNMLQAIGGQAEMLRLRLPDHPQTRDNFNAIQRAVHQAAALITRLLTFARKRSERTEAVDLNDLLHHAVVLLRHGVGPRIRIEEAYADEKLMVEADESALQNVILNLGFNARDAMPDGGALLIQLQRVKADGELLSEWGQEVVAERYAQISVEDTGAGMPREVRERIFEPFFTTKEQGKGTGLGLSTVLATVEAHHGVITVDSEAGVGTRFRILLPLIDTVRVENSEGEQEMGHHTSATALIIEDDVVVRGVMSIMLHALGYETVQKGDSESGLRYYREHSDTIDVIIVDMELPGRSGVECLHDIRQIDPEQAVVLVSGADAAGRMAALREAGFSGILRKPFGTKELSEVLNGIGRAG